MAKELSIGFVDLMCFQCSAGKVVEAQQSIAVPGQAFDRLVVFGPVGFKKEVDQSPSGAVRVCRLVRFGIFGRDLRMALSS